MKSTIMRITFISLSLLFLFTSTPSYSVAERRIALVIGNGSYDFGRLKNSANDANDIAATLKRLGFSVILKNDAGHKEMETAIKELGRQLKKDDVGLFFYAGHGVQIEGENYLIPIGANIEEESDVKYRAVNMSRILDVMDSAGNRLNIIILDACRNNPYAKSFRSTSRGLAIVERSPKDTLIAYSTSPNQVAIDGSGRNSPYTKALLDNMTIPGMQIEQVFKKVRNSLDKVTGGKQVPWYISSLGGDFYFNTERVTARESSKPERIKQSEEAKQLAKEKRRLKAESKTIKEESSGSAEKNKQLAMGKRPSQPKADENTGIEFIFVKGGCFEMGDSFGDGDADEKPVHEVCVDDFYMGKYEVTQRQWKAIMGNNPSYFDKCGDNCPVEQVSWEDIQEFINKLNSQSGKYYRIPTEAQWEYAARSGGKSQKWAGTSSESSLGDYAWYDGNSGRKTHPVGQKKPNGLGFYDMSGNVWEWCSDLYGEKYYGESPRDNPQGPSNGTYRVLRGGSWLGTTQGSRAATRIRGNPDTRGTKPHVGFRVAVSPR